MPHIQHTLLTLGLLICLSACAPKVSTSDLSAALSSGDVENVIASMEADTHSQDEMWYHLDLARLYQVQGDYEKSKQHYEKAEQILDEYEERAKISMRNVGSGAGSLLFSKGAETYYGKGYERSLMHTLNACNYISLGQMDSAGIELRKMEKRQEFWLAESTEKIKEAAEKKAKVAAEAGEGPGIPENYSMRALLEDPDVAAMVNNYQDPFSYVLSCMIALINEDMVYAQISAQRAALLSPEAHQLLLSSPLTGPFLRNIDLQTATTARPVQPLPPPSPDSIPVTVLVLAGRAPSLKIENIPIPIGHLNYTTVDIPALNAPEDDLTSIRITHAGTAQPVYHLLRSDKLAYKTLKDELPMEIAMAIVRAASKGGLAYAASESGGGDIGGLLASVVMNVVSAQMELSFRNWELLPNSGFLASFSAKRGDVVDFGLDGQTIQHTVDPQAARGVMIFVSVLSNNIIRIHHATY
ncbi:hypothetical protein MASR1M90_13880 [Desulfovibrionales bacterium]